MNRLDYRGILADIKTNRIRLASCPQHRFPAGATFGKRWTCERCSGHMDAGQALAYMDGFKAAGGDPAAVWPDYQPIPPGIDRIDA